MNKGVLLLVVAAALALAGAADAEVQPGNIAAGSIQTAYPIQQGTTYHGAFQPDTATYHDLDYLAFNIANAGESIEFTLQNTSSCTPPGSYEWCPVYASILNRSNTLVADGAGTIATYGDTELLDWTFSTPGTYYLVMESNGDEPSGSPTYTVSYKVLSLGSPSSSKPNSGGSNAGRSSSGGSNSGHPRSTGKQVAPLVRSLRVPSHQHGSAVSATLKLGQRASVRVSLMIPGMRKPMTLKRAGLSVGSHRLVLRIPSAFNHFLSRFGLSVRLRVSVKGASGRTDNFTRYVQLSG